MFADVDKPIKSQKHHEIFGLLTSIMTWAYPRDFFYFNVHFNVAVTISLNRTTNLLSLVTKLDRII